MSELSDALGVTEWLDQHPIVDTGLKATGVGAGAYATLALVREVLDALEDRKKSKKRLNPGISKDTIVVRLPNTEKGASARDALVDFAKIHKKKPGDDEEPKSTVRQARNQDGTYARGFDVELVKESEDGVDDRGILERAWSYSGQIGAGVGGLGLGWIMVQKVHDYLKQKRLKREIAAAQQEYIDTLYGTEKSASGSGYPTPRPINKPGFWGSLWSGLTDSDTLGQRSSEVVGVTGGVALLVAAASAYITKKFMDEKFKDAPEPEEDNRVKNIVFKTASGDRIEMNPAAALAYVKIASIDMKLDFDMKVKEASLTDGVWNGLSNTVSDAANTVSAVADDLVNHRGRGMAAALAANNMSVHDAAGHMFSSMGMPGGVENRPNWKVNTQGINADSLRKDGVDPNWAAAWYKFHNADDKTREEFQKEMTGDAWSPYWQEIAGDTVNQYLDRFNNSEFGKTWFGQALSPVLGWIGHGFGDLMGDSAWGQRLMFNKMVGAANGQNVAQANPSVKKPKSESGGIGGWLDRTFNKESMFIPRVAGSLLAMDSRAKIVGDMSNRDLVKKVEELLEKNKNAGSQKKKNPSKIMHFEFEDDDAREAVERKKKAILKAVEAIDAEQD